IQETEWAKSQRPRRKEIKDDDVLVVLEDKPTMEVTHYNTELHFRSCDVRVTLTRFQCKTNDIKYFETIQEVTCKVCNLLGHTPVKSLGINFEGKLKLEKSFDLILKDLFVADHDKFVQVLDPEYQLGGIMKYMFHEFEATLTIRPSGDPKKDIFFTINYHKRLGKEGSQDIRADELLPTIPPSFVESKKNIEYVIRNLLGKEKK
ncbi:MAG: hypothetical protein KJ621_07160, partial [Proteobacteria bacterium]|nr:hypothetical protein [Pseudomonadota bacterium]